VQTIPAWWVRVDGDDVCYTPVVELDLEPGRHEIYTEGLRPGGVAFTHFVNLKPDTHEKLVLDHTERLGLERSF